MPRVQHPAPSCQVPACAAPAAPCPIPDVIPFLLPGGGISILAGAPNVGKTALLACLLRDLQAGRPILGHACTPPPAIGVINCDRGWAAGAGLWFQRAGLVVPYYSLADDIHFQPKKLRNKRDRTDILFSMIDSLHLPPYSVVCPDPISLWLGGNLLDYDTCAVATSEIHAYLRDRQYSMLATAHSAKLKADKRERYARMQDQVLGSTAITGFSDSSIYLASPLETGKEYYSLVWHPHGAKEELHYLERDEVGLFTPYSGVDVGTQARVLALFPDSGVDISLAALVEYAEALPLSKATVKRALEVLVERGVVEKVKHGLYQRARLQ